MLSYPNYFGDGFLHYTPHFGGMQSTDAFSLLSSELRQNILRELHECGGLSNIDELTKIIPTQTCNSAKRIKVELVHVHLPKLEDHGVIEYDRRNGDVVLTKTGEQLKPLLSAAEELENTVAGTA